MDGADKLAAAAAAAAVVPGATPASIVDTVVNAAEAYFEEDLRSNKVCGRAPGGWALSLKRHRTTDTYSACTAARSMCTFATLVHQACSEARAAHGHEPTHSVCSLATPCIALWHACPHPPACTHKYPPSHTHA